MSGYDDIIRDYWTNGYAVIPNFLSSNEVDNVLKETEKIIDAIDLNEHRHMYRAGKQEDPTDYYLRSGQNISYFFEETAFDKDGKLIVPKNQCLQKIDRIKTLIKKIGFVSPHIAQSLVNFKHPRIGTTITAHQDATFLFTEPEIKLIGFWIPLEDATLENGCLWFIPGSHNEPVKRRWVRTSDGSGPKVKFNAPEVQYDDTKFVPVPVPKGSLVLIHGQVVHKSEANTSNKPRPAYTFHVVDLHDTKWASDNWNQPTKEAPFIKVY
uniref:Fe2OG dioxygenase domain-containing protein n=1 Tax=Tetranychus urticae TaxID=32264 RepID=T1KQ54_TETUR